jgi:type IV pilus assembly protein PilV
MVKNNVTIQKSTGFSMLEMLVALLVLSIGLLGVATLQVRGQQFNQVGYLRTQATFLAYDIMDRMRINIDNDNTDDGPPTGDPNTGIYADDGGYNFPTNATYPPTSSFFQSEGPSGTGNANDSCDVDTGDVCDVQALRDYDLDNWFNLVRETLPEGQAVIVWIDEDTNNNGSLDASEDIINNGELDPPQYRIYLQWANIIDRDDDAAREEQQWIVQFN